MAAAVVLAKVQLTNQVLLAALVVVVRMAAQAVRLLQAVKVMQAALAKVWFKGLAAVVAVQVVLALTQVP